jgi:hypothetical protein
MTRTVPDRPNIAQEPARRTSSLPPNEGPHPDTGFTGAPEDQHEQIPAADIAAYMADMLMELRTMARRQGFDTLGRVLEIAESEAKLRMGDRG